MEAGSLQYILATLAQFGSYPTQDSTQITAITDPEAQRATTYYDDSPNDGSTTPPGEPSAAATKHIPQQHHVRSQTQSGTASPKPMIDPANITQWQEALRCVTKIAVQNAQFAISIKRVSNLMTPSAHHASIRF